jgi:hypothetical protein
MTPTSPFAVGEIVWFVGSSGTKRIECEVVSELYWGQLINVGTRELYEGWLHDIDGPFGTPSYGGKWCAPPDELRKIPGKGDLTLVDWSQCAFDPNRLIIKV